MRNSLAVLVAFLSLFGPVISLRAEDIAKVGAFESVFSEKSPLVDAKLLQKRFKLKDTLPAFNFNDDSFFIYIPKEYGPAKPIGLIVLANYKETVALPDAIFPQLDEANIAFVVSKRLAADWPERAALAIHAAHNMKLKYAIDPKRVYIFGGGEFPGANGEIGYTAERLGLYAPDVFTGTFCFNGFATYMTVKAANGGSWTPKLQPPDAAMIGLAKQHPFVFSADPNEAPKRYAAAFTAAGYSHVKLTQHTKDQLHYPLYTTDWLPDVLKFLDDATSKLKLPTSQLTTKPTK